MRSLQHDHAWGMGDEMNWTNEAEDLLKKLWADGISKSVIGDNLHCSRNSVSGKLNRLGLLNNGSQAPKKKSPLPRIASAVRPRSKFNPGPPKGRQPDQSFGVPNTIRAWNPPTLTQEYFGKGVPLIDSVMEIVGEGKHASIRWSGGLQLRQCRWVINEQGRGGQYLFCGAVTFEDESYCAYHCANAYVERSDSVIHRKIRQLRKATP
jgi:GcrA cell cycle regulator